MVEPTNITPDYLLIGHIAHDVTPHGPQLGGTVSYAAHTAVAFGLRVAVLTSTCGDEPLLHDLPPAALVISVPAEHTTTFENRYTGETRTQYMYHRAAPLGLDDVPPTWLRAPLVHLAPIAYEVDPALAGAFDHSRLCVTPQGWMRHRAPDGLVRSVTWPAAERVLPRATVTVISREDIRHDPGLETVFAGLSPVLVVTDGMHGGTVYRDGQARRFPADLIRENDPTGAGDIFATTLHIAWQQTGDLDRALCVAARIAGQSVSRAGFASAPTRDEITRARAACAE
jgi:hypothetical protein